MFRALPPSGVPIKLSEILAGIRSLSSGAKAVADFNREVCQAFGMRHAITVSSGRAGLSLLFRAFRVLRPGCSEVLIPAYTSFSVPSAVVHAGLTVSLYDIDPATLSPVAASLVSAINEKTLCIVVCHLFGFPADLDEVLKIAQLHKIPVVDDAAQAMGALYRGKQVGTFGAAGLFSLSRGKNITAVDGGIVVTNDDELARELSAVALEPIGAKRQFLLVLKAVVLSFLLHPRCYWLPRSIPSLNLGVSHFEPDFPLQCFTSFQAGIGSSMLKRLAGITAKRMRIAQCIAHLFSGNSTVQLPHAVAGAEPVFLRFPVLVTRPVENATLGVVRSYPAPVQLIPGIEPFLSTDQEFPGAVTLAEAVLTLPTHCYVTADDCQNAVKAFS